jgi:hypothetical protein
MSTPCYVALKQRMMLVLSAQQNKGNTVMFWELLISSRTDKTSISDRYTLPKKPNKGHLVLVFHKVQKTSSFLYFSLSISSIPFVASRWCLDQFEYMTKKIGSGQTNKAYMDKIVGPAHSCCRTKNRGERET